MQARMFDEAFEARMKAQKQGLLNDFESGAANGFTHMVVLRDTFDNTEYTFFAKSKDEAQKKVDESKRDVWKQAKLCYSLSRAFEEQYMSARRFFFDLALT